MPSYSDVSARLAQLEAHGAKYDAPSAATSGEPVRSALYKQFFTPHGAVHDIDLPMLANAELARFRNALSSQSGIAGAYTFSGQTVAGFELALHDSPIRAVATIERQATASQAIISLADAGEGVIVGFGETEADPTFSAAAFAPLKFSGSVTVPYSCLRDSSVIDEQIGNIIGSKIGRRQNRHFTRTITKLASSTTAASATAISTDDAWALVSAVGGVHAQLAKAMWMGNAATYKHLMKLVDGQGAGLWHRSGLGQWPFVLNEHLDDIASGKRSLLFGNFARFVIRDVNVLRIYRVLETAGAIDNDSFKFQGYLESDGVLLDPGDHPIACLLHP